MTAKDRVEELVKIGSMEYNTEAKADIKLQINEAVLEKAEQICTFIEEQNAMVNTLWGEKTEPGRHDAFVRDIVKAIREGKPNG